MRKYYTLVTVSCGSHSAQFAPQFGDYVKKVVEVESREFMYRYDIKTIICTEDTQDAINFRVQQMNEIHNQIVNKSPMLKTVITTNGQRLSVIWSDSAYLLFKDENTNTFYTYYKGSRRFINAGTQIEVRYLGYIFAAEYHSLHETIAKYEGAE